VIVAGANENMLQHVGGGMERDRQESEGRSIVSLHGAPGMRQGWLPEPLVMMCNVRLRSHLPISATTDGRAC
jgi:hypothetical protein